jgi:uncharacterized short protein YbdD (DUF466 family)
MRKLFGFLPPMISRAGTLLHLLVQTLRLMVGVGDYAAYVKHIQQHHADIQPLTREQWFRLRQDARYGVSKDGSVKRCLC